MGLRFFKCSIFWLIFKRNLAVPDVGHKPHQERLDLGSKGLDYQIGEFCGRSTGPESCLIRGNKMRLCRLIGAFINRREGLDQSAAEKPVQALQGFVNTLNSGVPKFLSYTAKGFLVSNWVLARALSALCCLLGHILAVVNNLLCLGWSLWELPADLLVNHGRQRVVVHASEERGGRGCNGFRLRRFLFYRLGRLLLLPLRLGVRDIVVDVAFNLIYCGVIRLDIGIEGERGPGLDARSLGGPV